MATVTVPLQRFTDGDLPPTCAVSGIPAANVYAIRAGSRKFVVPLNGDVARSIARVQLSSKIFFVAALTISIVGLAFKAPLVVECASIPFVIGVGLMWAAGARLPRARILGENVRLERVHPSFIRALVSPPGKCAGCTNVDGCSVAEMAACEAGDEHAHAHPHNQASESSDGDATLVSGT